MGAFALTLLLMAEALVSVSLGGLTLHEHLRSYGEAGPRIGLAAQFVFALFPVIRIRTRRTGRR